MMWINKAIDWLNKIVFPTVRTFTTLGTVLLFLVMLLTVSDVFLRYFLNRPIMGAFDITEYLMGTIIASFIAYCGIRKGHVQVNLVLDMFPQRTKAIINCITSLLSVSLFSLIAWQCFEYTKTLFYNGLTSTVLLIPRFPFAGLIGIGSAILSLVLLKDFFEYLSTTLRR